MLSDAKLIERYYLVEQQLLLIKNIKMEVNGDEIRFMRISGRQLFSTKDISVANSYLTGVLAERSGLDG